MEEKKFFFFLTFQIFLILSLILIPINGGYPNLISKIKTDSIKDGIKKMSWLNVTVVSDGFNSSYWNNGSSSMPAIAIDAIGTIHIVWNDFTNGTWGTDQEIMYANYTVATGWSNATVISDGYNGSYWNTGSSSTPAIAVDYTGTIHVVWADDTNGTWGTDQEIMYANYTVAMGWSNATVISDGYNGSYWNSDISEEPVITVDTIGTVHVVWTENTNGQWGFDQEIMYVNYTTTEDWSNITVISDGINGSYWNTGYSYNPAITVDNMGVLHVVWADSTSGKWGTDFEIMYANYSAVTGWTNATVISDGYNGSYWNSGDSYTPAIATDDNETIHVVWRDSTASVWGGVFPDYEILYINYTATTGWSNATVISDGYNGSYWNDQGWCSTRS